MGYKFLAIRNVQADHSDYRKFHRMLAKKFTTFYKKNLYTTSIKKINNLQKKFI